MTSEVQSLLRGLSLLEALAEFDTRGASLQELSEKTSLSPSTAHRLLTTFVEADYVTRGRERSSYVLGHRIIGIAGSAQLRTAHLRVIVRPYLEAIAEESGETANLVALDGRSSVYIDQAEGKRVLHMSIRVGSTFPANTSASAKAILAFQNPEQALRLIFGDGRAKRYTRRTIVQADAFRADLQSTRERGFAIEREEVDEGVSCIAAPILDRKGVAIAAVSVPGPTTRILNPTPDRLGNLILAHTAKISQALGARYLARRPI
ncbi:IclR family transcriptional regulator [Aminobacter ciceronei]|uniref:IclR family acetate operon transcriptional repressor n=1 Tax=Aminobacter ciceronei TaxID=150723 RepID=A0ABR6C0A4_9HYPH|nr:IclR family transcriptional regulator [Aminobacter ciceronei]MBA8904369.1 IclR family acetate operon transcriptional repressor [Aminobacter ciceronei]MBA9018147.1 IclR family acetate operon transcriptional repressor [Aminobacter ciceronei]